MEFIHQILHYIQSNWIDIIGYVASVFVAATFYMKTIIPLRILAMISNLLFICYASLAGLYPVLLLHIFLFPLNIIRLREMKKLITDVKSAILGDDTSVEPLLPYMRKRKKEPCYLIKGIRLMPCIISAPALLP
jgi:CRP/FNR family transcriptional regulator, cyclic AMP receptor protein